MRDHDYVIPANHEVEVVFHDHNYAREMPFVEIEHQQVKEVDIPLEEDEEPVGVDGEPIEEDEEPPIADVVNEYHKLT